MKGSSVKSGLAMILIGLSSHAMAANFLIDCDNSQSFTLMDYTIPGPYKSALHTANNVFYGTTDVSGYGGNAHPFQDYTWTASFDNGAILRIKWSVYIRPGAQFPVDMAHLFVGSQVSMTFWNERGEITAKTGKCAFARVW